jgi:hypothetical protein
MLTGAARVTRKVIGRPVLPLRNPIGMTLPTRIDVAGELAGVVGLRYITLTFVTLPGVPKSLGSTGRSKVITNPDSCRVPSAANVLL